MQQSKALSREAEAGTHPVTLAASLHFSMALFEQNVVVTILY